MHRVNVSSLLIAGLLAIGVSSSDSARRGGGYGWERGTNAAKP